jgi:hypothetical protein
MGSIANVQADVVQLLSGRTTVAVTLGLISKSLRAIAGIVLQSQGSECEYFRKYQSEPRRSVETRDSAQTI